MTPLILALALIQTPLGAPAPSAALVATAPVVAPAEVSTAPDYAEQVRALQAVFDQSCGQRAYGSYDDICTGLGDQLRAYRREADRAQRSHPAAKAPVITPPAQR